MRTLFTFLLAGLLSMTTMANSTSTNLSIDQLTKHIWTSEKNAESVTYYDFQEPSALDIITKNADGSIVWNTAFWDLVEEDGTYLVIKQSLIGDEIRFKVQVENENLVLSNGNMNRVLSGASNQASGLEVMRNDLIGMWKSPFYDLKNGKTVSKETKVRHMWKSGFQFNADGTFVRHLQKGRSAEHESGVWSLSNDGNFIKLHFAKNGNVEDIYKREVVNINKFKKDWMSVSTKALEEGKAMNSFELNKS